MPATLHSSHPPHRPRAHEENVHQGSVAPRDPTAPGALDEGTATTMARGWPPTGRGWPMFLVPPCDSHCSDRGRSSSPVFPVCWPLLSQETGLSSSLEGLRFVNLASSNINSNYAVSLLPPLPGGGGARGTGGCGIQVPYPAASGVSGALPAEHWAFVWAVPTHGMSCAAEPWQCGLRGQRVAREAYPQLRSGRKQGDCRQRQG